VAGVTDVFTAVDALTTVINAYGFAAEDATRISDIMFQTVKRGKLTFGELSSALGTVVPTAAQLGIRFEEIAAGMATLTRQGINVNTVTMQLRQVMMSVLKPTSEAKTLAKELGIEFTATALKAKGLSNFLAEITEKTKGDVTIMGEFFSNIRALSAVFGLAGKSAADFAYDISLMEDATGSTEVAFQKQMKTLDFWIRTASHALEDMKVAFYEGMVDPIRTLINSQEDMDKVFESLTKTAGTVGKVVGAAGVIMAAFQPIIDETAEKITNLERDFAVFVDFVSLGYIPAMDKYVEKTGRAWIEADRLRKAQEKLNPVFAGVYETIAKGMVWWQRQVDYYTEADFSAEKHIALLKISQEAGDAYMRASVAGMNKRLEALNKLRKGEADYQVQNKLLQAMQDLGLASASDLRNEYKKLQEDLEIVAKTDFVYTKQLETHVKKAMALAEITEQELTPALKKLAEALDLLKKKQEGIQTVEDLNLKTKIQLAKEQKTLTGVIEDAVLSGDFYESTMKKHVQAAIKLSETTGTQLSPTIVRLAMQFGIATNQMLLAGVGAWRLAQKFLGIKEAARETTEFLGKYAITMPPPMKDPPLTMWDKIKLKVQDVGATIMTVTGGMDAIFNQLYMNQMQRIDNEYQARKQAIDDSMDSDQEKYYQIEALDREMDKKRLAAKRKQAKATKATSLMEAIVHTASAVAEALPNIPLSILIGIMGAAQAALIASQPLPSFAKGGIAGLHGPEIIMVGEEGPERITPIRDERPPVVMMPGLSAGSRSVLFEVNYYITAMDALGVRDFVRDKAGPEMVEWIRLNKTEMLEALELE